MEWKRIELEWSSFKVLAAQRWTKLSEQQLDRAAGDKLALAFCLQDTYFMSPAEADRQIAAWQARGGQPVPVLEEAA